jgi:EAL and modified HD-GYP domain-containing signal transduction protein
MTPNSFPVYFHLLVDRQLVPGAVFLGFDDQSVNTLQVLSTNPDFLAFAAGFPVLISHTQASYLSNELFAELQGAGCVVINDTFFQRSDAELKPELPPNALWLDGNWFQAPPPRPTQSQSASRTLALKLLQLVNEDADTCDIEAILRQDPALSYHLLRLVNSLGMGVTRQIESFSQAILILGRTQLRRWLNLMLFAAQAGDYRAPMLLASVAMRARTMELLAKECGLDRHDQDLAFMGGMFSMLGILFGTPLSELVKPLQLSEVLVNAICHHQGKIGQLLLVLERAAQRDSAGLTTLLLDLQLTGEQFTLASLSSCQWMLEIAREVQ